MHHFFVHSLRREEDHFAEHYMPLSDDLFALAYRLTQDGDVAKDIVQDVLTKLWQMRDELPSTGADKAYCLAMVRNRCIDYLRREQTLPQQSLDADEDSPLSNIAGDSFYGALEAQDYLNYVLSQLPERTRQIVEFRLRDGFSFKEIEQLTGISEGNARVLLTRTLKRLRDEHTRD